MWRKFSNLVVLKDQLKKLEATQQWTLFIFNVKTLDLQAFFAKIIVKYNA
jgi:hypothetical protein